MFFYFPGAVPCASAIVARVIFSIIHPGPFLLECPRRLLFLVVYDPMGSYHMPVSTPESFPAPPRPSSPGGISILFI